MFWHIPNLWNNQALGIQKLQVTYGVGGGEFHPGIYPKAAALFKTHRPAGSGGPQRTRAYSKSQREGPPANHFRPYLGGQPASSVLLHRRQPSGKPEAKTHLYERRAGQRAIWKCCLWVSFLPHSSGSNLEEKEKAGTVLGQHDLIMTLQTPMIQHKETQLSPNAGPPSPGTQGRGDRRHGALLAVQREKEQTGRSYLIQGPTRGPARPFFCFCTSSGENGDDR